MGGYDVYALGFTLEPEPTNPEEVYWITLHLLDCNHWDPLHYLCIESSARQCYATESTPDWPWEFGDYGPYPGYPIIDDPPNFGKPPGCGEDRCAPVGTNPINFGTGNKFQQEVDFSANTPGPELAFRRFYNSRATYDGPLGYGWTHNYNLFIEDQGNRVVVWDADGKALRFKKEGGGNFTADPLVYDTLTQEGGGTGDYVLTRTDNSLYRFNSEGRLLSIKDRNDNQITLTYDGDLLTAVSSNFGREITITYNPNNKIETVDDPAGNTYTFSYIGDNLTAVAAPDGHLTEYLYDDPNDPHNMTEKRVGGQTAGTWGYDQHDRAISSSKADGVEAISVTYGGAPNTFDALRVWVIGFTGK